MAKIAGILAFLALSLSVVTSENKFAAKHSAILSKFHPVVKEFALGLSNKLGESDGLSSAVYDVITKNLASQVDDLVAATNGTDIEMCCSCKKCERKCKACGKSCCCKGSGGCSCTSCVSTPSALTMELVSVTDLTSSHQLWSAATKKLLVRELTTAVSQSSATANARCCECAKCTKFSSACGVSKCCIVGETCVCASCQGSGTLQMDSMSNFVALTPEAEAAVHGAEALVDELIVVMSMF